MSLTCANFVTVVTQSCATHVLITILRIPMLVLDGIYILNLFGNSGKMFNTNNIVAHIALVLSSLLKALISRWNLDVVQVDILDIIQFKMKT